MQNKSKKHILIIDDDLEVIEMLKDLFEGNDFFVGAATNGTEGLDYFKHQLPDLVISDLLLPGEHGLNVIKVIKEKYFLPVIIISSIYKEGQLKSIMEEHFVEAFFEKPLKLSVLLEKVNSILNARTV
ncbi:MAG: two-component system, OmpR family, response regulator VanR [Acidobacteriota bacterium]|nr:two-component system, OmpR family, response regulator VanR [Acidobacteriota bacterium]